MSASENASATASSASPGGALPRLTGRTVVVTGASSGIGAAAARRFAAAGAEVVVVGRSPDKTAAVAAELGTRPLVVDYERLADVRRLADDLLERCERIDVLAHNAGGTFGQRKITEDGVERTFQVNHLSPFLLTALLRERVEATPGARVITTSSAGNLAGRIDLADLDGARRTYRSFRAYGTGKLLNIVFTRELARRLGGTATAACFHPGVVATDFGRDARLTRLFYVNPLTKALMSTPEQGAAPLLWLATAPEPELRSGGYFDRFAPGRTARQADDPVLAREVWERSAQLAGVPA